MDPEIKEYLIQRFLRNNHKRYHKYVLEWINGVTQNQINYFRLEKERIGL